MVRSFYHQQGVTKGSLQSQKKKKDSTELKTSFDSSRLEIYYHWVQSHPNTNTYVEMPLKSSADKEDKNTSTKLTKSVKVYVLEKDRNTIQSNGRLDDNFINESQNILKKQFPNIGGWKDTLLCQTSFSAVSEESVQITTLGKIVGFFQRRSTNICGFTTVRPARNGWT